MGSFSLSGLMWASNPSFTLQSSTNRVSSFSPCWSHHPLSSVSCGTAAFLSFMLAFLRAQGAQR